jgi:anhydro-N-acetylmuramic acid kinase
MTYNAIGLMSGSSLDGLDIAFVRLTEQGGQWRYEWIATECVPYSEAWQAQLRDARSLPVTDFLRLHTAYGHYTGQAVRAFLKKEQGGRVVDFIASHGHTIFHDPANGATCQIGDGASIAAETGLPVISDLRNMDVAYGGQGAPIVPLGEQLLFPEYDYWLNLGGIANITCRRAGVWTAFDVCACNQALNALAAEAGREYDEGGAMAAAGIVDTALFNQLNSDPYFSRAIPKSLDNAFSRTAILQPIAGARLSLANKLRTALEHMVFQIANAIDNSAGPSRLLATGGGALNSFLIHRLGELLRPKNVSVVVPEMQTVQYKEALIMALLGARRWRGEPTVLHTVTGARKSSVGGALWAT